MRHVDHHAVDADRARARIFFKDLNDALGVRDFVSRRGEGFVDRCGLRRVDRHLAEETGAACLDGFRHQPVIVAEIGEYRVDRQHLGRARCREAERAGELVGPVILAVQQPVVGGTKRGR